MSYQRDEVKAPRVSGIALKAMVGAMESAVGGVLIDKIMDDSGIAAFRAASPGLVPPTQVPLPHPAPVDAAEVKSGVELAARATTQAPPEKLETVAAFARAYREKKADPVSVVRALHTHIERLEGGEHRMAFFINRKPDEVLRDAEASAARLAAGTARSVFEGVPVVLKDELDVAGYPTTLGTSIFKEPAKVDSVVAARLRAAGAIILGKANMNEIGISTIGLNPHYGPARNPYNRGHITGGSSSASASVVAAGICPVSIGADGGGSIRVPSGLCGVVGLKATFGRVPETGVPPLCWNVGHVGPIGLTVDDVAAAYAIIAGPDEGDALSLVQPQHHLAGYENGSLEGLRVGVCEAYFSDAEAEVVAKCRAALKALTDRGAKVVEVPPPDLNTLRWTHSCIILSEMAEAMRVEIDEDSTRFALDSRINLALGRRFSSTDLVHSMRHRHKLTRELLALMKNVDVIITPTTGTTAPKIPEAALPDGESNLPVVDALMRFVRLGNLTGFPALALPAGYDAAGLPVSVQLLGRPWEENLLLRMGKVIEAAVEHRVPGVHVNVLG